ncbi:MAG: recombinase family protein [Ruminococcus sp.]|nr:recombinase family protein [Ruminococcus sp.]
MKGVIYARYSSDNQREESIEGQLRECKAFAEKNDIQIIETYIDRALSAKTDNRPAFQKMISDSAKGQFDVVIVWKLDRFARNRYDSAHYKAILKRNNVRVISATEVISQGPEGIILESLLEGMAEYYSAELAEKVVRGMAENAYKCKFNGGAIPFGYYIDNEQHFRINEEEAAVVREVFKLYNGGMTLQQVADHLNSKGIRSRKGATFKVSSVSKMLSNRRYMGEYSFREIVIEDGIPAIVSKDAFESANRRLAANKRAPAKFKAKADDEYILTTKLYCGKCMSFMIGESGTSRRNITYRYYKCSSAKSKKGCDKKPVKKDAIEDLVIDQIQRIIWDDELIDEIAETVMTVQSQGGSEIPLLTKQLSETTKSISNVMKAIEMGVVTETTKERLLELESQKKELEFQLATEKIKRPTLTKEQVVLWLEHFRELDSQNPKHRKRLVDTFVNAVILYDDRIEFYFNFKGNAKILTKDDLEKGSDLFAYAPPNKYWMNTYFFCGGFAVKVML